MVVWVVGILWGPWGPSRRKGIVVWGDGNPLGYLGEGRWEGVTNSVIDRWGVNRKTCHTWGPSSLPHSNHNYILTTLALKM